MSDLLKVTREMVGVHPQHPTYPLIPGDVLTKADDGTYTKHTGLGICGFTLNAEQEASLEPTTGQIVMASGWGDYLASVAADQGTQQPEEGAR